MTNTLLFLSGAALGFAVGVFLTFLFLAFLMGADDGRYTEDDYED